MSITIERPFAASEKGKRQNNEDCIFPLSELANLRQRLFMVCDGVGGAEKGEVASALACDSIQTYFITFLEDNEATEAFVNKAIQYTESCFDKNIAQYPESKGMATTMTLLYIGESDITLAHIGDSRIYQFREGRIIFKTGDHSLVQSLVDIGEITKEEAAVHPKKNVITRALCGTTNPVKADVACIKDIQYGDFFFLCTDGVTDCLQDEQLSLLFSSGQSTEKIKDILIEHCSKESKDNYSFYIIPIQKNQKNNGYKQFLLSFLP